MKRNYKLLILVMLFAVASCSFTTKKFDGPDKDKTLIELISYVLENGHYDPKDINDSFSKEVYKSYLKSLDPYKRYFLASDIKEFEKYETELDDQIKQGNIDFFNLTYERLMERMTETETLYKEILDQPFDFSEEEDFVAEYDKIDYAQSKKELKDRWRKQLKLSSLANYYDNIGDQDRLMEEDSDYAEKSKTELEAEARKTTRSSLDENYDRLDDAERNDWFSIYVNAIVEGFDPHSFYFAPQDKDRFDIAMSGKLEGIGARLQKKNDNVEIVEVISGGPAWRDQELEVGDVIMKVRQNNEKEAVNLAGMRLDDAVKLIKGPKGSQVFLTVRKVDGTVENIELTRDVVEIEETYAKSSTVKKNGKNYGVINLPKFYFDMENYTARNAATDVAKEIKRLKDQNMQGLILDLRNNGGGSLKTVVDIAGLFIKEGPIVQVKSKTEGQEVLEDKNPDILWDGPLVILVNELSASASEILAAAMQDYQRAIIIGSTQTYGKGTVQNVIDLNRWVRNSDLGDLGALKITTQKFYRINGGSTQLKGVESDVVVPDKYSYIDLGERDQENPLPWDQIAPVDYTVWNGYTDFEEAISNSQERMAHNEQLKLIDENAKWIKEQQDDNALPLNFKKYKEKVEQNENLAKRFDDISKYTTNLTFESLPYEKELFVKDTVLAKNRERWHENLQRDVYVEEALHVLEDLKDGSSSANKSKVANIKKQ